MLLERLLANLSVTAEPFALCEVSPGWRLRLDGLDRVALHYVLQGEGELRIGSAPPRRIAAYHLAVVPERLGHALQCGIRASHEAAAGTGDPDDDGLRHLVAGPRDAADVVVACGRVRATYSEGLGLFDLLDEPIVLDFGDTPQVQHIFTRMLEESEGRSPGASAMMSALMNECLVLVLRRLCETPECRIPWLNALDDERMAASLDAVLRHPERDHTVGSLAETARMSRSSFAETFASAFGRTPMAYVRDVRIRRAADLLRATDLPVATIARRVGFASRSHFSRAFQAYFGTSPTTFRASVPAEPIPAG